MSSEDIIYVCDTVFWLGLCYFVMRGFHAICVLAGANAIKKAGGTLNFP